MSSLESTFASLLSHLGTVDRFDPTHADPLFHFVHPPEETAALARALSRWQARLDSEGWKSEVHSLAAMMWDVLEGSGRWDDWLETEPDSSRGEVIEAVRDALRTKEGTAQGGLASRILDLVSRPRADQVLFLTDAALLHPYFRVRTIENLVHDRVGGPTVLFYPGSRAGQFGLRFLGFYPEDPNYRSTILGGAP